MQFFEKLEPPPDEEETTSIAGGYFSNFIGQIFRSDGTPQTNGVASTSDDRQNLERTESGESRSSEENGFQRSLTGKFSDLLKSKRNPNLKDYNDSNFKQYWMPDSTGRECYQCEERFTTFRRRHHCRLCGQIFCAKCCSSHIDGAALGYMGELRLCDYCARKVQRLAEEGRTSPSGQRAQTPVNGRKVSHDRTSAHKNSDTVKTVSNGAIWALCSPDTSLPSDIASPAQLGSRRSSLVPNSTAPGLPTILSVADLCASSSALLNRDTEPPPMVTEEEESGPDWFRTMNPGMDGVINNEASDSADVFAYANLAGAITNEFTDRMDARSVATPTGTDRKITFPSLSLDETIMNAAKQEQRENLGEFFRQNTERIVDEVLKREYIREDKWRALILRTVDEVVQNMEVNVQMGDSMNLADYVHVKKVFVNGGKIDSEIIWGVACSKSLLYGSADDSERESRSTESIMIVSGSIEYERVSNKLSSIEPIIVQEEKYLEKQIDRIATKRASLILVEGGVSRVAAQLLHTKGIKVAVNVKMSILQRVARSTGADIVSNSDAQLVEQNLGCCPEFEQRNMLQEDGRLKTLMIFGDCEKDVGCTVLLHGDDLKELIAVKRVIQFLITIVYSNQLEQSYLNAFNTTIARRQSDCIVCEKRRAIVYSQGEKTEFEQNLYATLLSSSPVIEFEPPFLETAIGRECPLIAYFKQPLYKLMKPGDAELIKQGYEEEDATPVKKKEKIVVGLRHAMAHCNKGSSLTELTKSFRLFGGISFRRRTEQNVENRKIEETEKPTFRAKDVLDPRVHQTLAVLFGSFSRKSPNAPYFCVRPWVVSMQYYKDHDMTLGEFLVKYCFNRGYECPSSNCEVSMLDHSRKLVYGRVCVEISTQTCSDTSLESDPQKNIVTWRNCGKCNCSSQMVKFDKPIWHLSFAKFLEYIGNSCFTTDTIYPINTQNQCSHCFFHEKLYFFAMENLVTTFKVNAIRPYSVVFSPIICNLKVQKISRKELADDVSRIATLALQACEDTNKQLAELDESVQVTPIVVKLAGAIRNTMALASESRMFSKTIFNGDEELIRSNDRLYREVDGTFMKVREVTYNLITLWNENCTTIKYPKKAPEDVQEIVNLRKLENPFPAHLHLSIKLQPRLGVVVRDIQDSKGNYKPDIGSIIAYALSAVDYSKTPDLSDTVSMDSTTSSSLKEPLDDGENVASAQHLEVEFEDDSASYYVKMFYAEKFRKLRELLIAEGEQTFIRSLSKSTFWTPQGGKSGSFFYRTQDDRFVVKQMSRFEIQSFVKFAPNYFDYLTTSATESKLTTLCKVYGVFRIGYKSKTTTLKVDILVMEYLFYNHNVSQVWDLKGSLRNRLASTGKSPNEMVLLDENFVKDLWNQQLYVLPHSKAAMNQAISNDSHFLSSQYIMDYSLLVGVDDDNGELILGIVDYMRTYTLDKKLESWVKIVAIPGAHLPTILSPEMYCARFSEAIDSYFPVVPDQWTGLGSIRSY